MLERVESPGGEALRSGRWSVSSAGSEQRPRSLQPLVLTIYTVWSISSYQKLQSSSPSNGKCGFEGLLQVLIVTHWDPWRPLGSEPPLLRGSLAGLWLFACSCRDDEPPGWKGPRVLPSRLSVSAMPPTCSSSLVQPSPALASPGCGSRRLRSFSSQSRRGRPKPGAPPSGRREGSPGRARARARAGGLGGGVPAIKRGRLPRRLGRLGPWAVGRTGAGRNSGRAG